MTDVTWNDEALRRNVEQGLFQGVVAAGTIVQDEAVRLLTSGPKTGRIYRRRGTIHRASAPGQAPASDTGRLASSGSVRPMRAALAADIVFSTEYTRALELGSAYQIGSSGGAAAQTASPLQFEFGTQSIEPRPFMRPALANKSDEILDTILAFVRANIGSAGNSLGASFIT